MQLYRADKRDFNVGDKVETAAEYFDKFNDEARKVEAGFNKFRPKGKPCRQDCLFLFETLDVAKRHWSKMQGGKLYLIEIPSNGVLHRGDMNWLDVIAEQTEKGQPSAESYRSYWNGQMTLNPVIEIMVASGKVIEIISKSQHERRAYLKKRWGMT